MSFFNKIVSTRQKALNNPKKKAAEFVGANRDKWMRIITTQAERGLDYAHCGEIPHELMDDLKIAIKNDIDFIGFTVTFDDDLGVPTTITFHWK